MNLHIVGGFLGSGKTTAIIGAARQLMAQGKRVGVVTNDQGKYLVDTAFYKLADVPTVEVTGGCFCCNYDTLEVRLDQLRRTITPDVIFAESVGSCADIIATVVKPLLTLRASDLTPTSFSVFADARLLRRRLLHQPMPFGDDIVYLFDKQIEEAGLLVINKMDLLSPQEAQETLSLARKRLPQPKLRLQNSLDADSIRDWVTLIETDRRLLSETSLDLDYRRYSAAKATMAVLDETIRIQAPPQQERAVVLQLIYEIVDALRDQAIVVAHLKFFIQSEAGGGKISFPTLPEHGRWEEDMPPVHGKTTVLINAHAEANAHILHTLIQTALRRTASTTGAELNETALTVFNSGTPTPTHRVG